ncbi:MAG: response regulator [Candidatus Handelsmanbacteria bacterium]|nr:response regulator [Candidatus Handelsmanbacteria bacterium]
MAYILVVEDNPQTRRYLERIIRHRSKHELLFAGTGKEAIEKLVDRRPDLIFLDLFVPQTDCFELFALLRRHPATADIPIVIHTAVPLDPVTQMRVRRMRFEGFVEFPIEASELNRVIATALKRNAVATRRWSPPRA